MKFEFAILGAICLTAVQLVLIDGQDGNDALYNCSSQTVVNLYLPDSMTEGNVIRRFQDRVTIINPCDYMRMDPNNTVVLTKNLTTVCESDFTCDFKCEEVINMKIAIIGSIQRNQSYTLEFTSSNYSTKVKEMEPVSTKLTITPPVRVTVKECESFRETSEIIFGIKDGFGLFNWISETRNDSLHVAGDIDYERNRTFDLELYSINEYLNIMATTMLHVTVEDADDQNPKFDHDVYYLNITEENQTSVNQGQQTVPPIHAFDQDLGLNETIIYTILDQETAGLFEIDNNTGLIQVTEVLDREKHSSYNILIQATQKNNRFRIATATVSITVIDIDDNPPKFGQDHYNVSINEHAVRGTLIVTVTATDPDKGVNGEFKYKLSNTSVPVEVEPKTGRLTVTDSTKFDRESYINGIITVQVEVEPVNPSNSSLGNTTTVTINLIDINDNNPNFTQIDYHFTTRGSKTPYVVGQVLATDADVGANANVTYSFLSSSQSSQSCQGSSNGFPIIVDMLTGNLTVKSDLYCGRYTALVEGCDNPLELFSRRCSLVPLSIQNGMNVTLRNVSQEMFVTENAPNGTTVGVIECQGGSYEITNGKGEFTVEQSSRLVVTNKILDREESAIHYLSLSVLNSGMVVCSVNLTVWVTDVNDNAPVFMDTDSYIFNLTDSADVGLGIVEASDKDEGINGEITFDMQSHWETRFYINSTTGMVFVTDDLVDLEVDIVRLMVTCEDHGKPSLKTTEAVYILPKDQPANFIPLRCPLSAEEINNRKTEIASNLEKITGIEVMIQEIQQRGLGSMIQLEYTNKTLKRRTVLELVVDNYEEIRSAFYTSPGDTDNTEFGAAEIGLVVMGAFILIGAIVAIVIVRKQCDSAQKYKHLYESLTRNSSIYESQEIKVRMEDDSSDITAISNTELTPTSTEIVTATVNPVFQSDDDITEAVTNFGGTMDSLEGMTTSETTPDTDIEPSDQLSAGPEHEENENGNAVVYDHVNTNRDEFTNGTKIDDGSDSSIPEQEHTYVNENYLVDVLSSNNADTKDNDDDDGDDDDDDDDQNKDNIENSLAQKILQASSQSPVMSRRNEDDATESNDTEDNQDALQEPDPDYDIKQVRFSTQVLDTTENKIEPLKPSKDDADADLNETGNDSNKALPQTVTPVYLDPSEQTDKDTDDLMLEEDINSPVDFLSATTNEEFYFGTDEETTHF